MGDRFEIGRVWGLPIFINVWFILLIVMWGQGYFTSGNTTVISLGFLVVVGLALSLLAHEFAHAIVGHFCGWSPSFIELHGFGGFCHFSRTTVFGKSLRANAVRDIVVSAAGPAANYLIYWLLESGLSLPAVQQNPFVGALLSTLAATNLLYCYFNLLPAFGLDGGSVLYSFLTLFTQTRYARLIVGALGMCVCAWLAYISVEAITGGGGGGTYGIFTLYIAANLGLYNYEHFQSAKNPPWQRWN